MRSGCDWWPCSCSRSISTAEPRPFWRVLEASWGGFFKHFGIFFRYNFHTRFLYVFNAFLMEFCTLQTSKNEHFAWEVLQKSNFHVFAIEYLCESILRGFWVRVGGIFRSQLELKSDFESRGYKVCFLRGVGTISYPPPP